MPPTTVSITSVDASTGAIEITATKPAVYVWLSSLAHGHFEDNGTVASLVFLSILLLNLCYVLLLTSL